MTRLFYIILAFVCISCSLDIFSEEEMGLPIVSGSSSQINPAAYVNSNELPPAATKAMINVSTVSSMEANAFRIDEYKGDDDMGTDEYDPWENAYLVEATVASPNSQGLRSMTLNPVQAYSYKVNNKDTTFYHTRMVIWYPRTFNLHKNDEGKASVMKLSDYSTLDNTAYSVSNGNLVLNFKGLDGSKDVMVSNVVEGQHWHSYSDGEVDSKGTNIYTYPFGQNESSPTYLNYMTYKHYLSAVKIYAYSDIREERTSNAILGNAFLRKGEHSLFIPW